MASAAALKIRTAGLDPGKRTLDDSLESCSGKARFIFDKGGLNLFAFEHERNKDTFAGTPFVPWKARQPVAPVNQLFNLELH